jgi:hypothetical protein
VEPFIEAGLPFLFFIVTRNLEYFRHILAFEGQSSKMMNVFYMDWIPPIQPETFVMHSVDKEFGAPRNITNGTEHW